MNSIRRLSSRRDFHPLTILLIALCCASVFVWWVYEPFQSHYLIALRILGDTTTQNFIGVAKDGRGDEWATYLPFLKQASLEGFPDKSALPPYYESFNWFINIPKADFSLIFLPNNLAYFLFPPGKALSFQGFYYNFLMLVSMVWYLRNLRIALWVSVVLAISTLFSHFYQVWWTSNFPVLAAIFLPFAVFTSTLKPATKTVLLFWSIGHLVFGQLYPPFYVSMALALLPLTFAIRPDLLRVQSILSAAVVAVLALSLYFYAYGEFVSAVSETSYPGRRFSQGGGSTWSALLSSVLPTLPVEGQSGEHRLYELSVVGTIIPVFGMALLPWVKWDRVSIRITVVTSLTVAALSWYAVLGFPTAISKYTGLFLVPGTRVHMGLSILINVFFGYLISKNIQYLNRRALLSVSVSYAVISTFLAIPVQPEFPWYQSYPYVFLGLVIAASGLTLTAKNLYFRTSAIGKSVLFSMAGVHVVIFGSFNPIMRASDIMTPADTPLVRQWRELHELNAGAPFAIAGNYGHLLRGEGLPALEAIHLVSVDRRVYEKVFPYLNESDLDRYFNRFVGITFDNIDAADPRGASIAFPLLEHAVLIPHVVKHNQYDSSMNVLTYDVDGFLISEPKSDVYRVRWSGVLEEGIPLADKLRISLTCNVVQSILTRGPIPGDDSVESWHRLVTGVLSVDARSYDEAKACMSTLSVTVAR